MAQSTAYLALGECAASLMCSATPGIVQASGATPSARVGQREAWATTEDDDEARMVTMLLDELQSLPARYEEPDPGISGDERPPYDAPNSRKLQFKRLQEFPSVTPAMAPTRQVNHRSVVTAAPTIAAGSGFNWMAITDNKPVPGFTALMGAAPKFSLRGSDPGADWVSRGSALRTFVAGSDAENFAPSFSQSSPLAGWLRAVFDNGVWTAGMNFDFQRNAAIETMAGSWSPHEPRFGQVMGVQPLVETTTLIPSLNAMDFLGSGWQLDGQTPLICVFDETINRMEWFTGHDWSLVRRQNLGPTRDLLGGQVSGKHYRPVSGIIHEGLHVIMTERWDVATAKVDGIGFFYTQDFGVTWTEVPNVTPDVVPGIPGHPASLGISRGARWSFANAFPHGNALSQTDAWFPWGDYLRKNGSPKGGQVGIFRATRDSIGSTWTVHPNRVIWNRWEPSDSGGLHTHGATVHPTAGTVLSWWGDVGYRNEIVSHKFDDLENYTTSPITTYRQVHGGYVADGSAYLYGNQAAGFAPGPEYGTALAAADESPERLVLVSVDPSGTKIRLEPMLASSTNDGSGTGFNERTCLWIHYVRGRGYVLRELATTIYGGSNRTWVSEDGRVWTSIMAKSGETPVIFGNRLLFSSAVGFGIKSREWAPIQSIQPLLINPGGWNRQSTSLAQRTAPAAGNTVRELYRDANGLLRYVSNNELLQPQPSHYPPISPHAPLVEIKLTGNRNAGIRWLMNSGETANFSNKHYWLGWVYPLEPLGLKPTYRLGGPQTGNQTAERGPSMNATDSWAPTYHFGSTSTSTPSRGTLSLLQMNNGPNRWILASQSLTEGFHPPYPLHPGQQGPNELAKLTGIVTRRSWTSFLSLALPAVGFDAWHANGAEVLTLATLWSDSQNYAELKYYPNLRGIELRIFKQGRIINGWIFGVWLGKEDRMDVVISTDSTKTDITLCLPQNNAHPTIQTTTLPNTFGTLKEIQFSNRHQTEVVPLKWLAAHVHPTKYFNLNERVELLKNPALWLRP